MYIQVSDRVFPARFPTCISDLRLAHIFTAQATIDPSISLYHPPSHIRLPHTYTLYYYAMAKSTRSKVKRAFRAKKRQDGVYAVTEAARLQRLNLKLCKVVSADKEEFAEEKNKKKKEHEDADTDAMPVEEGEGEGAGWSSPFWFSILGLVDPHDITAESMGDLARLSVLGRGDVVAGTITGMVGTKNKIQTGRKSGARRIHKQPPGRSGSDSVRGLDHLLS